MFLIIIIITIMMKIMMTMTTTTILCSLYLTGVSRAYWCYSFLESSLAVCVFDVLFVYVMRLIVNSSCFVHTTRLNSGMLLYVVTFLMTSICEFQKKKKKKNGKWKKKIWLVLLKCYTKASPICA